jgi:hypothetical protein
MLTVIEKEHTVEKRNQGGQLILEGTKHYEKHTYFLGIRIKKRIEHATIDCEEVSPSPHKPGFKSK